MVNPSSRSSVVAVLWDLDGVLIDSEKILFEAERRLLAEHGVDLTPELKRPFIGLGGRQVLAELARSFGLQADLDDWSRRKILYALEGYDRAEGFAPTTQLVRSLARAGVPMAVASGSPIDGIDRGLCAVGLDDVLPVRVSADEVAAGKPAPDVFLEAARRLQVPASGCVVVEDAVPGLLAAHAAGMRCIAIPSVPHPLDPRFEQADLLVREGMAEADSQELLDWLLAT